MKKIKNQKIILIPAKPLTKEEIFVSEIVWGCVPVIWINKVKYHDGDWIRQGKI